MKIIILFFFLILNILQSYSQTDSLYNVVIQNADENNNFRWLTNDVRIEDKSKYELAKQSYYKALLINPKDNYSRNRIIELDRILNDLKSTQLIIFGDSCVKLNNFLVAIQFYNNAKSINTTEGVKLKIALCTDILNFKDSIQKKEFIEITESGNNYLHEFLALNARDDLNLNLLNLAIDTFKKASAKYESSVYLPLKIKEVEQIESNNID